MARHLIIGSENDDDLLQALATADLVHAYGGADSIDAGGGNDLIYAGADSDTLVAGDGNDRAFGGAGHDVLNGGLGDDTLHGGAGSDMLVGAMGADWLYGGTGDDQLYSASNTTGSGENQLFGGVGNDLLDFDCLDGGGADGGAGWDVLDLTSYDWSGPPWDGVNISLIGGNGTAAFGDYLLTISGIEVLILQTYTGDDTVVCGAGDDQISVHLGRNLVDAGAGDDQVSYFTGGANTLDGGTGTDTLMIIQTEGLPALVFSAAAALWDGFGSVLTNFERLNVRGAGMDDQAILGAGADMFLGGHGNDSCFGMGGNDTLDGQRGEDVLTGDDGADLLRGGRDHDVLDGGDGKDTLIGGEGTDFLHGGAGADAFRFGVPEQYFDHITGFESGLDRLVFRAALLDLDPGDGSLGAEFLAVNGPDAAHGQFVFFDSNTPAGNPGELRWDPDGTGVNGGTTIAMLYDVNSLTLADFLLS